VRCVPEGEYTVREDNKNMVCGQAQYLVRHDQRASVGGDEDTVKVVCRAKGKVGAWRVMLA